jgi:hypothetical protein
MSLTRRVSLLFGAAMLAIGSAGAQSLNSPNSNAVSANASSSSDSQFLTDFGGGANALAAATLPSSAFAGGTGAGQQYGEKHGLFSLSRIAGEAGGGFNGPIGNDTSSGSSSSTTYGGPYMTWGGNFTGGLGLRFSQRFSLLGEYQFIDDKLPGAFIAAVGTQGGNAHIWSLTLDPVIDLFPKAKNSVYVTGGGGFYRKVTNFTDPEEGEQCYSYCGIVVENETVFHFSSNQGGMNLGVGFTHHLGNSSYGDTETKLFAEARYLFVDTPNTSPTIATGHTEAIPVTVGVRW